MQATYSHNALHQHLSPLNILLLLLPLIVSLVPSPWSWTTPISHAMPCEVMLASIADKLVTLHITAPLDESNTSTLLGWMTNRLHNLDNPLLPKVFRLLSRLSGKSYKMNLVNLRILRRI